MAHFYAATNTVTLQDLFCYDHWFGTLLNLFLTYTMVTLKIQLTIFDIFLK